MLERQRKPARIGLIPARLRLRDGSALKAVGSQRIHQITMAGFAAPDAGLDKSLDRFDPGR